MAEQLARGAQQGDDEAIGWLVRAAREAAARSPDVAADLLERAAALMDPQQSRRDQVLAERAGSLMLAGRIPDALAGDRALLDRDHDTEVDGRVRTGVGRALLAQGQVRDALRELRQADLSPASSDRERAVARGWVSLARLSLGDLDGAEASAQEARTAAASLGDPMTTSIAMTTLARVSESRGRLRDALLITDGAVRLADDSPGRLGHRFPVRATQGYILIELDRLADARSALTTGMQISEELGVRWPLASYQAFLAFERFTSGEWDDAIAELEASIELAEETGFIPSRIYAHGMLSMISLHRNDLGRAEQAAAAAARDLAGQGPGDRMTWAEWPRALILEALGKPGQALGIMTGIWDMYASSGIVVDYPALGADLVRVALAAGDAGLARRASVAVTDVAARNDVPWMTGAALHCRGLAEDDAEVLQAAAAAYARGSRPLGRALACHDAGTALARLGQTDRARPLLDEAIGIYERLGAARDLARADATLRDVGVRRGRRGARQRPQIGWHSLTPTELTVAGLVAEGLSNPRIGERLYVSHRTVQTHLAHIFAKLDISSRAQLAAEVTRRSDDEPRG